VAGTSAVPNADARTGADAVNTKTKWGGGKVGGASLRGGKMRGTVRGINARRRVICEAGMCEAQWTTGAAGVVVGCSLLSKLTSLC